MAVHAAAGSTSEWLTPKVYVEAARAAMGSIDLDPFSCVAANEVVQAESYYTKSRQIRDHEWHGNVFMNPPYSDYRGQASSLTHQVLRLYKLGRIKQAVVLLNQSVLYQRGPQMMMQMGQVCIPDHRIAYIDSITLEPQKSPPQSNAFLYVGPRGDNFKNEFRKFGVVK